MELREFSPITESLLQQVGKLRVQAWATQTAKAAGMDIWLDRFDPVARHWLVFENNVLLASARMTVHATLDGVPESESYAGVFQKPPPGPIASLNRLVVHPSARGRGLSKELDQIRLEAAEKTGCRCVILSTASGPHRIRQLRGWGFELAGYGPRFKNPPLSDLPAPAVLISRFPRLSARSRSSKITDLTPCPEDALHSPATRC